MNRKEAWLDKENSIEYLYPNKHVFYSFSMDRISMKPTVEEKTG